MQTTSMPIEPADGIEAIQIPWDTIEENPTIDTPEYTLEVDGVRETVTSDEGDYALVFEGNTTTEVTSKNADCLGDVLLCSPSMGFTYFFRAQFIQYEEDMYFISSGAEKDTDYGISFLYHSGKFRFTVSTSEKIWFVETHAVEILVWHDIAISWSEEIGIEIYIDGNLTAMSGSAVVKDKASEPCGCQRPVFFGRATDAGVGVKANFMLGTVTVYFAHWQIVLGLGELVTAICNCSSVYFPASSGPFIASGHLFVSCSLPDPTHLCLQFPEFFLLCVYTDHLSQFQVSLFFFFCGGGYKIVLSYMDCDTSCYVHDEVFHFHI